MRGSFSQFSSCFALIKSLINSGLANKPPLKKIHSPEPCNPIVYTQLKNSQDQLNIAAVALSNIGLFICFSGLVISLRKVINFMKLVHIPHMKSCDSPVPVTMNQQDFSEPWLLRYNTSQLNEADNNKERMKHIGTSSCIFWEVTERSRRE